MFSFDLGQVTERQVELHWSDLSSLNPSNHSSFDIFLEYHEELDQREKDISRKQVDKKALHSQSSSMKIVRVPIPVSFREVTVAGLSPGSVYSFTLKALHPAGATWILGQTRIANTSKSVTQRQQNKCTNPILTHFLIVFIYIHTGPLSPHNITVDLSTFSQIGVHWTLPEAHFADGWTFVVRYVDMSSNQERIVGMTNISTSSPETGGLQSYSAVIRGLESYRKYMVEVYTITQHGIESCAQMPLIVHSGKHAWLSYQIKY